MDDVTKLIEVKKAELVELKASRPKGTCTGKLSTEKDVTHEMAIEELEDEISQLEEKLK